MDLKLTILICITFLRFVKCIIPLSVRKFDSKLIERKRQDTLEICRLFNEENKYNLVNYTNNINTDKQKRRRRIKRDVGGNTILKDDDVKRIEEIVDKLYDDVDPNGNQVNYRRRDLNDFGKTKHLDKKEHRRFNFAPAQLFGPAPEKEGDDKTLQSPSVKIPWVKKWKHGIVPFFIDSNTYDSYLAETILRAFDYIEKVSCIRLQRLRERPTDKRSMESVEWLYITNPSGVRQCVHSNERKPNTGVQMVVLGYGCLSQGEIAHEVMHILGFSHEHTRPDRDRYITILWDNIKSGYKKYFEIRKDDPLSNLPYDYASVLHYPPRAFSRNGQVTIMTNSEIKVGQRDVFSELDVEKIGMIYGLECVERNKDYLIKTCPSVVKAKTDAQEIPEEDIENYFKDRIWPYGIINYKIKDSMEFTAEERENIKAVLIHIEKETCIEFRDITAQDEGNQNDDDKTTVTDNKDDKGNDETSTSPTVNSEEKIVVQPIEESDNENSTNFSATTNSDNLKMTMKLINYKHVDNEIKSGEMDRSLRNGRTLQNKTRGNKRFKAQKGTFKERIKKVRIPLALSPARRHAANVIIFKRSTEPGCKCPSPGRPNGNKILTINSDCFNSVNDLLHLVVHVLGLDHQHNMYDRDSYLHILWDNLTPEVKNEMQQKLPAAASAGFAYDYQSVMHYPWLQIKDGVTNIMYPIWNDGWAMGHWQGLSWTDVQKLNLIYRKECENRRNQTNNE